MDYAKPSDVVASLVDVSLTKLALGPRDLLIRGAISGALLGASTSLAFGAAVIHVQRLTLERTCRLPSGCSARGQTSVEEQ